MIVLRRVLSPTAAFAALVLAMAACGGGSGDTPTPTPTTGAPAATPLAGTATPAELGAAPIFYRPLDNFASLRAGEAYKILFRVTGEYAEETLPITATSAIGQTVEFAPARAEPVGEGDPPGSYYPFSLLLPEPGLWEITIVAGSDELTFSVEVQPAATPEP